MMARTREVKQLGLPKIVDILTIVVVLLDASSSGVSGTTFMYSHMCGSNYDDEATMTGRKFTTVASNLRREDINVNSCDRKCWINGFSLSVIDMGRLQELLCFCGNEYGPDVQLCSTPPAQQSNVLYTKMQVASIDNRKNLDIAVDGALETFKSIQIRVNSSVLSENGISANLMYSFLSLTNDVGLVKAQTTELLTNYTVLNQGYHTYSVRVRDTKNPSYTKLAPAITQEAVTRIGEINISCPEYVTHGETFTCNVTIFRGSSLQAEIDFGDNGGNDLYEPTDAKIYTIGHSPIFDQCVSCGQKLGLNKNFVVYFDPNLIFQHDGTLAAIEFYSEIPGEMLDFVLYRPQCPDGEFMCFKSYSCIPDPETCSAEPDFWATTCITGEIYSFSRRACINTTTGEVVDTTPFQSAPRFETYRYIGGIIYQVENSQENYLNMDLLHLHYDYLGIDVTNSDGTVFPEIKAGDVLAVIAKDYYSITTTNGNTNDRGQYQHVTLKEYEFYGDTEFLNISDFNAPGPEFSRLALRAHYITPTELRVQHTYTDETIFGEIPVRFNLSNPLTADPLQNETSIGVEIPIVNISIVGPDALPASEAETVYSIPDHPGGPVQYTWNLLRTDNPGLNITSVNSGRIFTHTFTNCGAFSLEVIAQNNISRETLKMSIAVLEEITNLTAQPDAIVVALGDPAFVNWSLAKGTNVSYEFTVQGDLFYGPSSETILIQQYANVTSSQNDRGGYVLYNISDPGDFTVVITACNALSCTNTSAHVSVQIPIENPLLLGPVTPKAHNVTFLLPFSVQKGTHAQFDARIDGIPIQNVTYNYSLSRGVIVISPNDYQFIVGDHVVTLSVSNVLGSATSESIDFRVEYAVGDVTVAFIPYPCIETGNNLTFEVHALKTQSNINVKLVTSHPNRNDSFTLHEEFIPILLEGEIFNRNVFIRTSQAGHNWVHTTLENVVGSITIPMSVNIENRISHLTEMNAHIIPIHPNDNGTVYFTLSQNVHGDLATREMIRHYDFGDGSFENISNSNPYGLGDLETEHTYTQYGTYQTHLQVENCVNSKEFTKVVNIDRTIEDLTISVNSSVIAIGMETRFILGMSWGSRATVTTYFGDKEDAYYEQYIKKHTKLEDVFYNYTKPGVFSVYVEANNSFSRHSAFLSSQVYVHHPVRDLKLQCDKIVVTILEVDRALAPLTCLILIKRGTAAPTNASISVDFNDTTISTWGLASMQDSEDGGDDYVPSFTIEHPHGVPAGQYNIKVQVSNDVSNVSLEYQVTAYDSITGLKKQIYSFDNETGENSTGVGDTGYFFPLEDPILFLGTITAGSRVTYFWDFGDGIQYHGMGQVLHQYSDPGVYEVRLNVSNAVGWSIESRVITVQRSCADAAIYVFSPRTRNTTFPFQLSPGVIPTKACYFVDLIDDEMSDNRYVFVGDASQCLKSHPVEWNTETEDKPRRFLSKTDNEFQSDLQSFGTANITFDNVLMTLGAHNIRLVTTNQVSSCEMILKTVVTRGPCWIPEVAVKDENGCQTPEACQNGIKMIQKSKPVVIYSRVKINCTSSKAAMYQWGVFKVNSNGAEQQLDKDLLQLSTMNSSGLGTLKINPKILPYGLYKVLLNVTMVEEIGIHATDQVYIIVTETPLVAEISGGPSVRMQWGANTTIDGLTLSYDPDVDSDDKTGMSFTFYCRRICETWPPFDSSYNITDPTDFETTCTYQVLFANDRGCYMFDNINGPGDIDMNDVSGVIPSRSLEWPEVAGNGQENLIEMMMVVKKGSRISTAYQRISIVQGDPPNINIKCVSNCFDKVNPDGRFSLESQINGWIRHVEYSYEWELYQVKDEQKSRWNMSVIPAAMWSGKTSTGINEDNLAIDSSTFTDYPIDSLYYVTVKCWRTFGDPENWGLSMKPFRLNSQPSVGNCSVYPQNGTALETTFNIHCNDSFTDVDLPLTYSVAYRKSSDVDWTWVAEGPTPEMNRGVMLPSGLVENNYTVEINLRCTDALGSSSDLIMGARVVQQDTSVLMATIASMTEAGGMMDNLISSADTTGASQILGAIGGVLNSLPPEPEESVPIPDPPLIDETASEEAIKAQQEQYQLEKWVAEQQQLLLEKEALDKRKKDREVMIEGLKEMEIVTITDIMQTANALVVLTEMTDELNARGQTVAASVVENGIDLLTETIASEAVTADTIEEASQPLASIIGNLLKSIGDSSVHIAQNTSSCSSLPVLATQEMISQCQLDEEEAEEIRNEDIQMAKETLAVMEIQISRLSGALMSVKVAGESATIIESKLFTLMVDKSFSRSFDDKTLKVGENNLFTLPKAETLFGIANASTYFVQSTVTNMKRNPYTFSNQSDGQVNTEIMGLSLKNDTGGDIEIYDISEDILIKMTRDSTNLQVISVDEYATPLTNKKTPYHVIQIQPRTAIHIRVQTFRNDSQDGSDPSDFVDSGAWMVLVKIGEIPSYKSYDFNCTPPLTPDSESTGSAAGNGSSQTQSDDFPDLNTCFISESQLNLTTTSDVYVVVKQLAEAGPANSSHYEITVFTTQCLFWNNSIEIWDTNGCKVSPLSSLDTQVCSCNHLTSFGGGFMVPMNRIDLSNSAFLKLDENPVVFATMVCIMCLYLVLLIWARRADKADLVMAGVIPMMHSKPSDRYLYEVTVWTGARKNSGTSAKACMIITGDATESSPKLLWTDQKAVLQRAQSDTFLIACPGPLGKLSHIRIWHDNSGLAPSWYFSRMQITDLQTDEHFFFVCNQWLAVEEDDGQIDRVVPVAGQKELTDFNYLFWNKTKQSLTDSHIWISVFQRPAKSRFTRVQRLTCCLALLFSSMMASILWYKTDEGSSGAVYKLGSITFTLTQLYVGLMASLMVLPPNLILVSLFRMAAPKPISKRDKKQEHSKRSQNYEKEDSFMREISVHLRGEDSNVRNDSRCSALSSPDDIPRALSPREISFISITEEVQTTKSKTKTKEECSPIVPVKTKAKQKFQLPWWIIYFAYFLAFGIVAVAFWLTVEVAGVFGKEKSEKWLISFCVSVIESIFLSQPIKALVLALFYALLIRKPPVEEEERPPDLQEGQEWLPAHDAEVDDDSLTLAPQYRPPRALDQETINRAREKRLKEVQMAAIIRECVFYLLFLYLLMMVAYSNRDESSYRVYENFRSSLIGDRLSCSKKPCDIVNKQTRESLWAWLKHISIPALFLDEWYDGNYYSWMRGHTSDNQAYLIGEPRLRQHRVSPQPCPGSVRHYHPQAECKPSYSIFSEETNDYAPNWETLNRTSTKPTEPWIYSRSSDLDGLPFWGIFATYSGGGYVATLGKSSEIGLQIVENLEKTSWLDDYTRAIFFEFLVYNPNVNLFGVGQIAVEYTKTGAGFPYFKFHVLRLNRYIGTWMLAVLVAEVLTLLFIVFFTFREFMKMIKMKRAYFRDAWNMYEVFTISLCIAALVLFFYRLFMANRISGEIQENPNKFHNFQSVVLWDEVFSYLLAIIVTLANIKFIKLLRFNKRMSILASTLRNASGTLLNYLIMFAIVFMAFAQMAYLMFYTNLADFSTIVRTAETLFASMLNKFDFASMEIASRLWGPIIIFLFTLVVSFVMINFFITIITISFYEVKSDLSKQSNDYEIVDFMIEKFKKMVGMGEKDTEVERKYADEQNYVEGTAQDLRKRVDMMMEKLMYQIADDASFAEKKKRKIFVSD